MTVEEPMAKPFDVDGSCDFEKARAYWDYRAETFGRPGKDGKAHHSYYRTRFLQLLRLQPGETVLDMGCATGTLAIPMARAGASVLACDFSTRMIELLDQRLEGAGLPVRTQIMAWEDDWDSFGLCEDSVDVAIASRSATFKDQRTSFEKLDRVARNRAAVTISAGHAPMCDPVVLRAIGRDVPSPAYLHNAVRALQEMGRFPEVTYIPCERPMRFEHYEIALMELGKLAGEGRNPFTCEERRRFESFAAEHFKRVESEEGAFYQLDYTLNAPWAFIFWLTNGEVRGILE